MKYILGVLVVLIVGCGDDLIKTEGPTKEPTVEVPKEPIVETPVEVPDSATCPTIDTVEDTSQELVTIKEELAAAKDALARANTSNSDLRLIVSSLGASNDAFIVANDALVLSNASLVLSNSTLLSEIVVLDTEIVDLQTEVDDLVAAIPNLGSGHAATSAFMGCLQDIINERHVFEFVDDPRGTLISNQDITYLESVSMAEYATSCMASASGGDNLWPLIGGEGPMLLDLSSVTGQIEYFLTAIRFGLSTEANYDSYY